MKPIALQTPIQDLFMVGERYARKLGKLDIQTVEDLVFHFPYRWDKLTLVPAIGQLVPGEKATVIAKIVSFKNIYTRFGKKIQKGIASDATGQLEVIFFNQSFLTTILKPGLEFALSGLVEMENQHPIFKNPDYELLRGKELIHSGRIVPQYPETAGLSSKWLRSRIWPLLQIPNLIQDWLPNQIKTSMGLIDLYPALCHIHFPATDPDLAAARRRLAFDELFLLQLHGQLRRQQWQDEKPVVRLKPYPTKIRQFISRLAFHLTDDQESTVRQLNADLTSSLPTNRLIQGDVGAGKTVVAAIAIFLAFLNRQVSCFMAPTEILAEQHYQTLLKLFKPYQLKINLLTSSQKKMDERADLYIGTHALLFRPTLPQPALVVIDEQHRFGVEQRGRLLAFPKRPHLLAMTATPIPRTITLALYGDLSTSFIKQMPKGRKKVKTWVVPTVKRQPAYDWIKKQIRQTRSQVFIICPLIDESASTKLKNIKAVTQEFDQLAHQVFTDFRLALLHGRIKAQEKNQILADFKKERKSVV
jgi:ATP-dependent DNA helicase RecG